MGTNLIDAEIIITMVTERIGKLDVRFKELDIVVSQKEQEIISAREEQTRLQGAYRILNDFLEDVARETTPVRLEVLKEE